MISFSLQDLFLPIIFSLTILWIYTRNRTSIQWSVHFHFTYFFGRLLIWNLLRPIIGTFSGVVLWLEKSYWTASTGSSLTLHQEYLPWTNCITYYVSEMFPVGLTRIYVTYLYPARDMWDLLQRIGFINISSKRTFDFPRQAKLNFFTKIVGKKNFPLTVKPGGQKLSPRPVNLPGAWPWM